MYRSTLYPISLLFEYRGNKQRVDQILSSLDDYVFWNKQKNGLEKMIMTAFKMIKH